MIPSDIFIKGKLEMSSVPVQEAAGALMWDDLWINRLLVVVAVLICIAGIRELFRLLPSLFFAFSRPRASVSMEYNTSLVRIRNAAALVSVLPFSLLADRFGLFRPAFWSGIPPQWSAAATIGVVLSYLVLRTICSAAIRLPRMDPLAEAAVHRGPWSWFILLTLTMLSTAGLLSVAGATDNVMRIVLYAEIGLFYMLSLLRSGQIFAGAFSGLTTILYLCGLELLPTAILAACAIFL